MNACSKLLFVMIAIALVGCGSLSDFRETREAGPSIFVSGSVESVRDVAVIALAERRLVSPQFEKIENGFIVYAEQSAVSAMVFNSYGGYGKVTIKGGAVGGKNTIAVSAITRSRAINEPVGPQDVLKGQNFNDPNIAIGILDRINGLTKERAQ